MKVRNRGLEEGDTDCCWVWKSVTFELLEKTRRGWKLKVGWVDEV